MAKTDQQQHQECVEKFIELANQFSADGVSTNIVSNALMHASGVYASYVVAGNSGGLSDSGVDKLAAVYKENLSVIQQAKREQLNQSS
jgi:hypothetical protein